MRISLASLSMATVLALTGTALLAGPLTPPPGPVAPTHKTLTEVEPRTPVQSLPGSPSAVHVISQPGSYYLTGNVVGVAGKSGVVIQADEVTLDLNGFALVGVAGSAHAITGAAGAESNVRIFGGAVRGWGGSGIYNLGRNIIICDVEASNNAGYGIGVGAGAVITRCVSRLNGGFAGIAVAYWSVITDCVSRENVGHGFEASSGTRFRGNLAQDNDGDGIRVENECTIENNLLADNDGAGVRVKTYASPAFGNRIENNNAVSNGVGVQVEGSGNWVAKNTASQNTTNYVIAAGNAVGVIVAAPASGAISGSSGGAGLGTTDPWANFSY